MKSIRAEARERGHESGRLGRERGACNDLFFPPPLATRSRVLARLASPAQLGDLARKLAGNG